MATARAAIIMTEALITAANEVFVGTTIASPPHTNESEALVEAHGAPTAAAKLPQTADEVLLGAPVMQVLSPVVLVALAAVRVLLAQQEPAEAVLQPVLSVQPDPRVVV